MGSRVVDLRSDTATRPTAAMRAAIAAAAVGDEQRREDPSVNELEERAARLLGQDEAIFLPTATMANQIAIRPHTELGGRADRRGELPRLSSPSSVGRPCTPASSRAASRALPAATAPSSSRRVPRPAIHSPRTRLLWIENTTTRVGGRIWPLDRDRRAVAHRARARPARPPRRRPPAQRLRCARDRRGRDRLALRHRHALPSSKGSAARSARSSPASRGDGEAPGAEAPLRRRDAAGRDRRGRRRSMRSTTTSSGSPRTMRARAARAGARRGGSAVDPEQVETNFVQVDVAAPEGGGDGAHRRAGRRLSATIHPTVLRAVTHLDVTDEDIDVALDAIPRALGARVSA